MRWTEVFPTEGKFARVGGEEEEDKQAAGLRRTGGIRKRGRAIST